MQNPLALLDQKIEERESLRHSTHRSQRSERISQQQAANAAAAQGNAQSNQGFATNNGAAAAQATGSDNFENANQDGFGFE